MNAKTSSNSIVRLVCRVVALAMGIAVVVLGILGTLQAANGLMLLGIGLTTLAFDALLGAQG